MAETAHYFAWQPATDGERDDAFMGVRTSAGEVRLSPGLSIEALLGLAASSRAASALGGAIELCDVRLYAPLNAGEFVLRQSDAQLRFEAVGSGRLHLSPAP